MAQRAHPRGGTIGWTHERLQQAREIVSTARGLAPLTRAALWALAPKVLAQTSVFLSRAAACAFLVERRAESMRYLASFSGACEARYRRGDLTALTDMRRVDGVRERWVQDAVTRDDLARRLPSRPPTQTPAERKAAARARARDAKARAAERSLVQRFEREYDASLDTASDVRPLWDERTPGKAEKQAAHHAIGEVWHAWERRHAPRVDATGAVRVRLRVQVDAAGTRRVVLVRSRHRATFDAAVARWIATHRPRFLPCVAAQLRQRWLPAPPEGVRGTRQRIA